MFGRVPRAPVDVRLPVGVRPGGGVPPERVDPVAGGPGEIGNAAVGRAEAAEQIQMNPEQKAAVQKQNFDNNQINMLANLIMQQNGVKTVQNDNLKWRSGIRPAASSTMHKKGVGMAQTQIDQVQGMQQINKIRNGTAIPSTDEAPLIDILASMSFQERQDYLKHFNLNHKSIYDPLPDAPDIYKINLITARANQERMYTY